MTLGELIERLAKAPQDHVCPVGFQRAHSWRGVYAELAFEPARNQLVSDMLSCAQAAVGTVFTGYKGGNYKMTEWTEVHLDFYGCSEGPTFSPILLDVMLGQEPDWQAMFHEEIV